MISLGLFKPLAGLAWSEHQAPGSQTMDHNRKFSEKGLIIADWIFFDEKLHLSVPPLKLFGQKKKSSKSEIKTFFKVEIKS